MSDAVHVTPSNEVHVTPAADVVAHEITEDCVCGPTTLPVLGAGGGTGWITQHHSLDGRERHE